MSETALEAAGRQQELLARRSGPAPSPTFSVRAAWMLRGDIHPPSRGSGTLSVTPDALAFIARHGGTEVVHLDRRVTLAIGLLCPPWASAVLLLHDRTTHARVGTSALSLRRLRRALRDNGFAVDTVVSWHAPPIQA